MARKRLASLFLIAALALGLLPLPALAASTPQNLALNKTATASGTAPNQGAPSHVTDGDIEPEHTGWNSLDLKSASITTDAQEQTPQWIYIDLEETGSVLSSVKIYYQANKVWPTSYELQTTDTPEDANSWETFCTVTRPSKNVKLDVNGPDINADGQNIYSNTDCSDTITTTSNPALTGTTLKRYVRYYIKKINVNAGGHNANIHEIQIMGTNPALVTPETLNINSITAANLTLTGSQYTAQNLPANRTLTVRGSTLENVVTNAGEVTGFNIGPRSVTLLARLAQEDLPTNYAEKNLTVTVADHKSAYPAEWFPAVTSPNPKPGVVPSLQEWYGYEGNFTLTESSRIVLDNNAANVDLQGVAEHLRGDLTEITGLTLSIASGAAQAGDIVLHATAQDDYALGEEGYLLRVADDGVHIYAPTYTGCLYGAVSVEQMLWLAEDHRAVPKGICRDYPAYEVRGLMLDVGRAPFRYQLLEDYARIMLWYKMSEYHLHINDNENVTTSDQTATDQTHKGFHRLESDSFPHLASMPGLKTAGVDADLVDADYYNDPDGYGGNPTYTKAQWRSLTQLAEDYGMYLLTELDMPGHALGYNQYVAQYPDEARAAGVTGPIRSTETAADYRALELLDLTGANATNAQNFATKLWDEYTSDGTITGNVIHIGADEYWIHDTAHNNAFAHFADALRDTVQTNLGENTKVRMWGAGGRDGSFNTATTALSKTHAELAQDYQLDIWSTGYEDAAQRSREGYQIVNCEQSAMYCCPGRYQRDTVNAEYVFNTWDPTLFGNNHPLLYGDPNLLGAKTVMWGEQTQEGLTERDVHQRLLRAIAVVSEKTWGGTGETDTFTDYELRAARLAEGPGTQIAMTVDSKTDLVLDYDFQNVSSDGSAVYDTSGNGYNAALTGGSVQDGWLTFNGSTLLETPLKTLSYPYTVTFDMKVTTGNTAESSLFSGYDGRIQVAGHSGRMSANNSSFIRDLGYTAPTGGTSVQIAIVGTQQAVRLYANGRLQAFLSQTGNTMQDGTRLVSGSSPQRITSYFSSVPFPLEKIGDGFHGSLANLKVYHKALTANELAADDALVNVAQNALAAGSSYRAGDRYDDGEQRTALAAKAVDGEAQEMYSFWKADHAGSALTLDLGETRQLSQVDLTFVSGAASSSFTLQTSLDGENWTSFGSAVTGNSSLTPSVTVTTPVTARYLRFNERGGSCKLAELRAYERVDKTALETALTPVETYAQEQSLTFTSTGNGKTVFDALIAAQAVAGSPLATQAQVDEAAAALAALDLTDPDPGPVGPGPVDPGPVDPDPVDPDPDSADKTALTQALAAADAAKKGVATKPDGTTASQVDKGAKFVTASDMQALNNFVTLAESVKNNAEATQTDVDAIVTMLTSAVNTFKGAVKTGTKETSTPKPPSPGPSPSGPSGGSSSRPSSPVSAKRDDGIWVTTATKPDGTKTETVELRDGTTAVKVTDPKKNVTITVTDEDGKELAKVEIPAVLPKAETKFDDVPEGHWAEDAIQTAVALGISKGVGDNKYELTTPMTRGALAAILHRLSQGRTDYAVTFKDVAKGKYYTEGIAWAAKTNVVKGISADVFAPDQVITREQLAVMMARYAKLIGMNTKADAKTLQKFSDGAKTGAWAVDGVAWCVENGILQGKGGAILDASANVTRAEVAVMLQRFINLVK